MFDIPMLTLKLLLVAYITAKRQLIHNRTAQRSIWNQSYDFIVVGAGASGCVVASRLSEDTTVNVLLLEAGEAQDAIYTDIAGLGGVEVPRLEFQYYHEPQDNLNLIWPGGRMRESMGRLIGGSSSHNQMGYSRAQRKDLDNWAYTYGAKGWSYRNVLPYYLRFENNTDMDVVRNNPGYHATNGPVQISTYKNIDQILLRTKRVFNELGYMDTDVSGANQTGTMITQSYIDANGFRSESGNAYVDPNPHPNNLHIVTRAMVLRILFNGLTAVGVEFDRNDTTFRVYARKEVILSAGPYQSPQLLMLSGVGPRDNLETHRIPVLIDLPVGNNYMNIPLIAFTYNISQERFPELTIDNLIELYYNRSGPLTHWSSIYLFFSTRYNLDKDWPNILLAAGFIDTRFSIYLLIGRIRSRGTVRLQSNNPYIPPMVNANLYRDQFDLLNAIEAVRFLLYVMERTSLAQYLLPYSFQSNGCPPCQAQYLYECTESIRCLVLSRSNIEHASGTCRMGAVERNDVVVDPNLLVKHAKHLRVCDTSIMPDLPLSRTTAEALMIGEKCSQIIKDCYDLK